MTEKVIITEESAKDAFERIPNSALVMLYPIAKYHEKYRLTQWVMDELTKRGFSGKEIDEFDNSFIGFYDLIINQDDL